MRESGEYAEFAAARDAAFSNETTRVLLKDYRALQTRLQAAAVYGAPNEAELERLQRLGELLQLDPAASRYLFAQFRLNALLADIYKALAGAVDSDLSMLED